MRTIDVLLAQARASFAQRSWGDAYEQFATADAATPLDLDDLERLALAAYLTGRDEESTLAWTRAHHEAIRRDDPRRAARNAVLIGSGLMFRGETAPAMGWFARGGRVLEGCGDCAEHAWLLTWNAFAQMWGGDPEGAQPAFAESVAAGQRFNDSDLLTMSRLGQGMCLVLQGQGPRRHGPAGRGHGRGHGWRGVADVRRNRLLHGDRRLFGALRPAAGQGMDGRAHPLVRLPARPRPLSGKLPGPSMRAHAAGRRMDRRDGGRPAGVRSAVRPGQVGHARFGLLPARRAAAIARRVRRGRGELPQGQRGRPPARTGPGAAPAGAGTHRRRGRRPAPRLERDPGAARTIPPPSRLRRDHDRLGGCGVGPRRRRRTRPDRGAPGRALPARGGRVRGRSGSARGRRRAIGVAEAPRRRIGVARAGRPVRDRTRPAS